MLVSYNWLKEYIGDSIPKPEKLEELLTFHSFEIEGVEQKGDDWVIDVDVLPNRSSDCLSHRGIAREIVSILGQPLVSDPLATLEELPVTDVIAVDIADSNACPRFTASLITGIAIKESPDWLKARLEAIGQRPINNIVDATNYVMYAIGQPLHAYDADLFPQVEGKWQFVVRTAREGEKISLLPEGTATEDRIVELKGTETLVVDGSNDTPIGLAGVKGGRFAGVHEGTTKVIIEAANWHPTLTRRTARPLGIITDAGKRFENEVTREMALYSQVEIVKLILDIAGGMHEGTIDVYLEKTELQATTVSVERANALLGLSLNQAEMATILKNVGCVVEEGDGKLTATGPWERTDLNIEEDYIEEIGRLHGYDKVASVVPETVPLTEMNVRHYYSEKIRDCLLTHGFSEVITSSFRKKDQIQLRNALASDKSYLRSSLSKNVAEVLDQNAGHADLFGATDTRVFEIGTVFVPGGERGVSEHVALSIGVRLKSSGYSGKEDKVLQGILSEVETALDTKVDWQIEKGVAEANFTDIFSKLPVPEAYAPVAVAKEIVYQPFSVYPHMSRDIAMWTAAGTEAAAIEAVLNEHAGDLRVRTDLFDEFTKDDKTSFAFRMVFQSSEKTLTDEEVNVVMDKVYVAVAEQGWEVR